MGLPILLVLLDDRLTLHKHSAALLEVRFDHIGNEAFAIATVPRLTAIPVGLLHLLTRLVGVVLVDRNREVSDLGTIDITDLRVCANVTGYSDLSEVHVDSPYVRHD